MHLVLLVIAGAATRTRDSGCGTMRNAECQAIALDDSLSSSALHIDRAADTLGMFNQPLLQENLIAQAQRRTGLTDFGEWAFREPLAVLLRAYQTEAGLTALGRIAVRWDMVRFLSNLLRLHAEEKNDPAIVDEQIRAPVFLLGLPRRGTTFLHNLMAQDPANLTPLAWQTIYPYPLCGGDGANSDPRPRMVARQFAAFLSRPNFQVFICWRPTVPRNASKSPVRSCAACVLTRPTTYVISALAG